MGPAHIKRAERGGELAPVNSFVGLSGGDQVVFPDDLMNCRSEVEHAFRQSRLSLPDLERAQLSRPDKTHNLP